MEVGHLQLIPTGIRVRVALLFVYLAIPIDVIPDFIPILGYADDATVVVLVLRSVCRRVSVEELPEAWPGRRRWLRRPLPASQTGCAPPRSLAT
jgi:uncharacterized membrane protein YkvA (DUF1232 family)